MNKIAIFTLQGIVNYGNRLQNYAVHKLVLENGYQPDSILLTNHVFLKRIIDNIKIPLKIIVSNGSKKIEVVRQKKFQKFNKKYLHLKYFNVNKLANIDNIYDASITGSDQVWNPEFNRNKIFFLEFSKKRICLSPSIAVTEFTKSQVDAFVKAMKGFSKISVREASGKIFLEKMSEKDIEVLVDPTMAIPFSEWEKIEYKPSQNVPEKYICIYVLGKEKIEDMDEYKCIKEDYKCDVIYIRDNTGENTYPYGPEEFIWMIHHAQLVITDSFHASVFSIIFHTPFLVLERKDGYKKMNSRIESLLLQFGFSDKTVDNFEGAFLRGYDFNNSDNVLKTEGNRIREFLANSISTVCR